MDLQTGVSHDVKEDEMGSRFMMCADSIEALVFEQHGQLRKC